MGITNRTHAGRKRNRDRTSYESGGAGKGEGPGWKRDTRDYFAILLLRASTPCTCIARVGRN